jgi:PIN domain
MEVHLVADTNLFFEFKALEQLPWVELGYDTVVTLLAKPVLDEIDKHKKANGRTRARALEIYSFVRGMLTSSVQEVEIQRSSPRVVLRIRPNVKRDAALEEELDYTKPDERLIGIVSTLNTEASGYTVKLFTDDTGPAATADSLGVPYLMINEGWRRPPSETTEEKRVKELERDLSTYRAQEPKIPISSCETTDESSVVEVTRRVATPLTKVEVERTLEALRSKHPLLTDFTPPSLRSRPIPLGR